MRTRRVRRSSRKGAVAFADCEVSSNANFLVPPAAVKKLRGAEYPVKASPNGAHPNRDGFLLPPAAVKIVKNSGIYVLQKICLYGTISLGD